jgi:hypothetical protein
MAFDGAERRVRRSEIKSADRHEHSRRSVRLHIKAPSIHRYLVAQCKRAVFLEDGVALWAKDVHPQNNLFDVPGLRNQSAMVHNRSPRGRPITRRDCF